MSDYEPFDGAKGDPWSTEPVGETSRPQRETEPDGYSDESQVLARVPDVADDGTGDSYRHYDRRSSGQRRHRGPTRRSGVPAPVWVVVGMAVTILVGLVFLPRDSNEETASEGPEVWQPENPAPDADAAPLWPGPEGNQWQDAVTVDADSPAPDNWGSASPTDDWVGVPPNARYAENAGEDVARSFPMDPNLTNGASTSGPAAAGTPPSPSGRDTSFPPAVSSAPQSDYRGYGSTGQTDASRPSETGGQPGWPESQVPQASGPSSYGQTQPAPGAWQQADPSSSLATPQPETVMPGYGDYPAAQQNPYVNGPTGERASGYRGAYSNAPAATQPQYPSAAPGYAADAPATGSGIQEPSTYPRTAMNPYATTPQRSAANTYGSTDTHGADRNSGANGGYEANRAYGVNNGYDGGSSTSGSNGTHGSPQYGGSGSNAYGVQPAAPGATYPPSGTSYPPAAAPPYVPQTTPAAPTGQPGYGTGASTGAYRQSVARLNGTIQEPSVRAAYNDRAQPSFY